MSTDAPAVPPQEPFTPALHPNGDSDRADGALGFAHSTIIIAVGAVILDDANRVLLVKHVPARKSFWQGKWICPGGRLQVGETIEAGILREVWEETHLHIRLNRPLVPFERIIRRAGEVSLHVIYIDYLAERIGGTLQPADDVGEALWVPLSRLPTMGETLHADTRRLLELAQVMTDG